MKLLVIFAALIISGCNATQAPIAAIESLLSQPTPEARRAAVVRQIKAVCPVPLSADEVEWAAQFVEENRSKGAVYVAGLLWKMNAESRICRGMPGK